MRRALIGVLQLYRLVISPLYGNVCRYYPSCSAYALRAVEVHGVLRGSWSAVRRLGRCHPWAPGGYDPVPGTPEFALEMRDRADSAATMDQALEDALSAGPARATPGAPPGAGSRRHASPGARRVKADN